MRKVGRIAIWVVGTVVVVAGGILLYLSSGPGEDFLRGLGAGQLRDELGANVSIERLETNVFSRVELDGVVIGPAADTGSLPEIRVDRLRVRYGLFTLILGGLEFDSVIVAGAQIAIRADSLPARDTPPETHSNTSRSNLFDEDGRFVPPVKIGYADLSNVTVLYDDQSVPISVSGSGISVTAEMDEWWSGIFRIAIDSTWLEYLDSSVSVTDVVLVGSMNSRSVGPAVVPVTVDSFRANLAGMRLEGRFDARVDSITGALTISGDPKKLLAAVSKGLDEELGGGQFNASMEFAVDDPLGSPGVTWSLKVPAYTVAGVPVTDLRYDGGLRSDTLRVASLSFGVYGGAVSGKGWMVADSPMAHNFSLTASGVRASDYWKSWTKAGQFTRIPVTVDARIETRGNLSSPADLGANAHLTIVARRSLVAAPAITWSRRHLSVRSHGGLAGISAELDLRDGPPPGSQGREYSGTVDLAIASLESLLPIVDVRGVGGSLEAHARLSGKGPDLTIEAIASSDRISYMGVALVDSLYVSARMLDDEVSIDNCTLRGRGIDAGELVRLMSEGGSEMAADASTDTATTTQAPDLFSGSLSYALSARGSIGNPSADLRATIEKPSFGPLAFNGAEVEARLSDSVLTIARAALLRDSSVTSVSGTIDLRDMAGEISGALTAEFTRPNILPTDSIRLGFSYAGSDTFSVLADSRHFAVASIREFVPSLPFNGGQLDISADVRKEGDSLGADIPFMVTQLAVGRGVLDSIAGTILFTDGTISVDSLTVTDMGRRYFLTAGLDLRKAADGAYTFDTECRTNGTISGDTVDLARAASFTPRPVDLAGAADVDLAWNGTVRRPKLRGSVDLRNVRYGPEPRSPWFTDLEGTIRIGDGAIRSDSITMNVGKAPILVAADFEGGDTANVSASLDVSTSGNMLLTARAGFTGDSLDVVVESRDLDLAVAQPFVESLKKLKGRLTTKLTVRGPAADPVVDGTLLVSGVSFEPGTSGVALTNGAVGARLSSGRIALDSASAEVGGGKVFASGTATVDSGGLKVIDVALKATGIKLTKKNLYQLNVKSTDLQFTSAKEHYLLTGAVEFGETRFIRDIEIGDIVGMLKPETDVLEEPKKEEPLDLMTTMKNQVSEPGSPPGFLQKVNFDIELKNADGLWVDNNLAKFRTNHDLRLQGTFDEATLTGRVSVRDRGELKFLDRRFEIINGVIDCSDPRRLNPVINLTATCDVTESSSGSARPTRYTVTLTVSGPLDEFDYALTSKPSLEQSDIFSLLALGMTQYQLEAGGNKDAVYKDRSEVLASQQISNTLNRFFDNMLGDMLALDHIGIGGNLFDPNQTRFEVTKRWSDRVEVKYSTSITNVDEQILSVEYKINDFLYLEGKSDQMEDSGADLKFRVWFK